MRFLILGITFLCLLLISCNNNKQSNNVNTVNSKLNLSKDQINHLYNLKILFGHKSVGYNIINGIDQIKTENNLTNLNVIETKEVDTINSGYFAHFENGNNGDPISKINAFAKSIEENNGYNIDLAFLKFCYVDITAKTNIKPIFNHYSEMIDSLENKYPEITFIHFTIPLTKKRTGIKNKLKEFKGNTNNAKRKAYNEMLFSKYDSASIFNLSIFEATYQDGNIEKESNGSIALIPAYTNDGGHLNDKGSIIIADKLLNFLLTVNYKK